MIQQKLNVVYLYSITANGCTVNTQSVTVAVNACTFTFNVKLFIQGFYAGSGTMRATVDPVLFPTLCDTVKVELHNITTPFALVET